MESVTTRVPATTSNLGPGYDCLGVALGLSNRVTITRGAAGELPPIVADAGRAFFAGAKAPAFDFAWGIGGEVPQARGLGSSVTVRLGVMHGLNELAGRPLDASQIFELCAQLEGHPDNAAPAAFGGFTAARPGAETLRSEVAPELQFVLLIPDFEVSTPEARRILPDVLPRRDVVMSTANACRITAAFLLKRYDLLRGCFADGLHQPYREPLVPFLSAAIAAGEKAGALGGFLSGSGSTICCLALDKPEEVAAAMLDTAPPGAHAVVTQADNQGATILAE
jgi:homoserine kinase